MSWQAISNFVGGGGGAAVANAMVGWHLMTRSNNKAHVIGCLVTHFTNIFTPVYGECAVKIALF